VAACSLSGLSSSEASRQRWKEERLRARYTWYTEKEFVRSRLYLQVFRKLPFGTQLLHLFQPLKLRIRTVRPLGRGFAPDPVAALGL
jgi:hypothetical protein